MAQYITLSHLYFTDDRATSLHVSRESSLHGVRKYVNENDYDVEKLSGKTSCNRTYLVTSSMR